jgi:hypothetical protein
MMKKRMMAKMIKFSTYRKESVDAICEECNLDDDIILEESEYEGRKVTLNDPLRLPAGSKKKFGVYVKNEKSNVVKVIFGDPNAEIKKDDPDRRASFRARHGCDKHGPKWKANIGVAINGVRPPR